MNGRVPADCADQKLWWWWPLHMHCQLGTTQPPTTRRPSASSSSWSEDRDKGRTATEDTTVAGRLCSFDRDRAISASSPYLFSPLSCY